MNKHKWHKEIKAWADGAEIEKTWTGFQSWTIEEIPEWQDSTLTFRIKPQPKEALEQPAHEAVPLYTHPAPAKEWVGLSDDEVDKLYANYETCLLNYNDLLNYNAFAKAIEQALKEKNIDR